MGLWQDCHHYQRDTLETLCSPKQCKYISEYHKFKNKKEKEKSSKADFQFLIIICHFPQIAGLRHIAFLCAKNLPHIAQLIRSWRKIASYAKSAPFKIITLPGSFHEV